MAAEVEPARRYLTVGSGAVTGTYFPVAGAVCRLVNGDRGRHGLRCSVEPGDGPRASALALQAGELDLAIISSDLLADGIAGRGAFAGRRLDRLRAVARLQPEPLLILARGEGGPASLADLPRKRIGAGPAGGTAAGLMGSIAARLGFPAGALTEMRARELPAQMVALCEGRLDAAVFALPVPNALYAEARSNCDLQALSLPLSLREALSTELPWLVPMKLPTEAAPGVEAPLDTVAGHGVLAATSVLEAATVRAVVLSLARRIDALRSQHPVLARLEAAGLPGPGLGAPLHEGAVEGYREAGIALPAAAP